MLKPKGESNLQTTVTNVWLSHTHTPKQKQPSAPLLHLPIDHAEQALHQVRQVRHAGALVREDGAVHGGQLGQALQWVLGHVRVLPNLPVHLKDKRNTGSNKSKLSSSVERKLVCLIFLKSGGSVKELRAPWK